MTVKHDRDPYKVLGLNAGASDREIKKAFRTKARVCHPDVAGDDPQAAERFRRIRAAYETLMDPVARARQDRRSRRRAAPSGAPGGFSGTNDLDLEDIFGDFGGFADFGFGGSGPSVDSGRSSSTNSGKRQPQPPPPPHRAQGMDIQVEVDVPARIARDGGSVSVTYHRRAPGAERVREDIATLRVPPGTVHGQKLRIPKMGHAGTGGGPPGDLVCGVAVRRLHTDSGQDAAQGGTRDAPATLSVSISEALLGGRVEVPTPGGRVAITLRPCTAGGSVMRLAGRSADGGDYFVRLQIVPPSTLDDESRRLIEAFADRNPYSPRD